MRYILLILLVSLHLSCSQKNTITVDPYKESKTKEYVPLYRGMVTYVNNNMVKKNGIYSYTLKVDRLGKDIYIIYVSDDRYEKGEFIYFKTETNLTE